MLNNFKWLAVVLPWLATGCVGISNTSPKETFALPRAYQEAYQIATLQAQQCWDSDGEFRIKGHLDTATRTAQVYVPAGLGGGRYGQVDIRALDDQNSEITTTVADINIWDRAAISAMHAALQFGVSTCTNYMPSARPAAKK
ncbi:MAG: hypothetical protein WCG12_05335 [Alcaligenaceae bacterium]